MTQANDTWAMLIPFAFATSPTRLMISWVKGLSVVYPFWIGSVSFRFETSVKGLQRSPRAIGDQGMEATLNHCEVEIRADVNRTHPGTYIEGREHLAFFFTVDEVVMILHWYEGCKLVVDGVVCIHEKWKSRGDWSTERTLHSGNWKIMISMATDIQTLDAYIARHGTKTCQHNEPTRLSRHHRGHASDKIWVDMKSGMNVSSYRLFNRGARVESMTYMCACESSTGTTKSNLHWRTSI